VEVPLIRNVEEFRVRFLSASGIWLDRWPGEGIPEVLPRGVEVKLNLSGRGEFTRLFIING
jgi:hypothetical protein